MRERDRAKESESERSKKREAGDLGAVGRGGCVCLFHLFVLFVFRLFVSFPSGSPAPPPPVAASPRPSPLPTECVCLLQRNACQSVTLRHDAAPPLKRRAGDGVQLLHQALQAGHLLAQVVLLVNLPRGEREETRGERRGEV